MLSFIDGTIEYIEENIIALLCGGVGYEVIVSNATLARYANSRDTIRLYTFLQVKEDGLTLFGFHSKDERSMFLKLLSVSGVGAKTALGILSGTQLKDLALSIVTGDAAALSKIKGIGKKTAERIVLELKEKVSSSDLTAGSAVIPNFDPSAGAESDAVLALMALGITKGEAIRAVNAALTAGKESTEDIIGYALRTLDR